MKWSQVAEFKSTGGIIISIKGPKITLPIPPFLGLTVGFLRVKQVMVNQGGENMIDGELHFGRISKESGRLLLKQGWEEIE